MLDRIVSQHVYYQQMVENGKIFVQNQTGDMNFLKPPADLPMMVNDARAHVTYDNLVIRALLGHDVGKFASHLCYAQMDSLIIGATS